MKKVQIWVKDDHYWQSLIYSHTIFFLKHGNDKILVNKVLHMQKNLQGRGAEALKQVICSKR